ncbi:MAG TPA: YbaK/EbsC family protein [Actinomycetota bacterium]
MGKTVTDYLKAHRISFRPLPHERAVTAMEEARVLDVNAEDVAKTVVLDTPDGHIIAVVPATRHVDTDKVGRIVGGPVELTSEYGIARDFPFFDLGGIPPIGDLLDLPILLDADLAKHERVVFAAAQDLSVEMKVADLIEDGHVIIAPIV